MLDEIECESLKRYRKIKTKAVEISNEYSLRIKLSVAECFPEKLSRFW